MAEAMTWRRRNFRRSKPPPQSFFSRWFYATRNASTLISFPCTRWAPRKSPTRLLGPPHRYFFVDVARFGVRNPPADRSTAPLLRGHQGMRTTPFQPFPVPPFCLSPVIWFQQVGTLTDTHGSGIRCFSAFFPSSRVTLTAGRIRYRWNFLPESLWSCREGLVE